MWAVGMLFIFLSRSDNSYGLVFTGSMPTDWQPVKSKEPSGVDLKACRTKASVNAGLSHIPTTNRSNTSLDR
jgi:hypothetical protein